MADPQGWKSKGANDPTLYDATITGYKVGASGVTGRDLLVTTNRTTGNFDVYEKTLFGNKLLYQYNASTNKSTPNSNNLTNYRQYFTGPRAQQLQDLNKAVKSSTFKLAENNVTGGQNSISTREFNELKAKSGYKSFGNAAPTAPPVDPQGGNPRRQIKPPSAASTNTLLGFEQGVDFLDGRGASVEELNPDDPSTQTSSNLPVTEPPPVLRYPLANLDSLQEFGIGYDYIKIRVVDYVPSLSKAFFEGNTGATNIQQIISGENRATERYNQNSAAKAYVILPMQPGINETNGVSWGQDSMNILQLLGTSFINNYFQGVGDKGFIEAAKNSLRDVLGDLGALKDMSVASKESIAALLAGYTVNANVIQRTTGTVINPNLELLFNGPQMRVFNFNFEMTPRFKEEAEVVRKIIKTFKKYMAPEVKTGNAFLKAPKIFLLDYIYNGDGDPNGQGGRHPYLNKIKPCALLNFSVNYTPDGTYMTYRDGGSMTRYTLQMTFAEVEPIYQEDNDLNSNDMGY